MKIKKLFFIAIFSFSISSLTLAESCRLNRSEVLTIGCSTNCGRFNSWALGWYARKLGYRLKIVNLASTYQSIDPSTVDGILIPGGVDIDPKWYMDDVEEDLRAHIESIKHLANYTQTGKKRDQFEFDLLDKYFADQKREKQPILGICRGMQVLTVSQKIPLIVDIKEEIGIKNRMYTLDLVTVSQQDSVIKDVVGLNRFRGVELHHQALRLDYFNKYKSRWPHLSVTALSNGGTIPEALEFSNRPILGVQFHPEYTFGRVRRNIFSWLLKKSCLNKKSKTPINARL